jgi:hypothetical protein
MIPAQPALPKAGYYKDQKQAEKTTQEKPFRELNVATLGAARGVSWTDLKSEPNSLLYPERERVRRVFVQITGLLLGPLGDIHPCWLE